MAIWRQIIGVTAVAGLSAAIAYGGAAQTAGQKKVGPVQIDPNIKLQLPPGLQIVRTRKSITALTASELASLRRGYAQMIAWNDEDAGVVKSNVDASVRLKGGEYFFAPSLPFLAAL